MNAKLLQMLSEHGDIWCMDASRLQDYLFDDDNDSPRKAARRMPKMQGRVAVVPVHGVLTKRGGWGMESTDRIMRTVEAAVGHKGVSGVVMDIDSPGGSSYGQQEFADRLHGLRGGKPIVAIGNPLAASAAYWTASAAHRVAVTPSGDMGHIGVWSLHMDYSQYLSEAGIKPTFVFAGKHKIDGNPFEPLGEEARSDMQASVNETYDSFVEGVARNRGVAVSRVRAEVADGRVYSAKAALANGLVDRIGTLEDVLREMGATSAEDARDMSARDAEEMLCAVWTGEPAQAESVQFVEAARARRERERARAAV